MPIARAGGTENGRASSDHKGSEKLKRKDIKKLAIDMERRCLALYDVEAILKKHPYAYSTAGHKYNSVLACLCIQRVG